MNGGAASFDVADHPLSGLEKAIESLLAALLAFAPLALGVVHAWSEEIVLILTAAISICFILKLVVDQNARFVWSWTYIPLAVFILLVTIQLIPLPVSIVEAVSPNTATVKKDLLGDLPNSSELLKSMTISFYPHATKHDLRLIFAVTIVFLVVVNVFRRVEQIKRLLTAIAIIGAGVAALALAQDLFGNGKIYWLVNPGEGKAFSGPFVNHSHYGQFMNLSIGSALGLILVKVHEAFAGKKITAPIVFEYLGSPASRSIWLLVAMVILGATTVFLSLTRGGMISMFVAAIFTTVVLSLRQSVKGHGWIMVLLSLGAFISVLYMGFDAVYDRLASLRELHQAQAGRWQIVKDISLAWTQFPALGTGQGTHEVVYPMYDRSTTAALAAYAENEYVQAAEETGAIGLAALAGLGILIWGYYVRAIRNVSLPIHSAAYGLGFGLVAILVHSLSDFGQHLPANGMLTAVSCALLLNVFHIGRKNDSFARETQASRRSGILRAAALICVSGVWAFVLPDANSARLAEARWEQALTIEQGIAARDWQASDEEYINLISNAAQAAAHQPDNIEYRHWLNVYRWKSISRITDPNSDTIVFSEEAIGFASRIARELHNARLLCPTYGATYCVVGQLEESVLGDPNGADCIRKGYRLAPCDPAVCFAAGFLDAEKQQFDASFEKFQRAIMLDGRYFRNVTDVYVNHVNRPDLAVAIAADNIAWLGEVANALANVEEHKEIVDKSRARIVELLKEKCSRPDAPAWALASLASIYSKVKDNEAAIEFYRQALVLDYGQVQWRLALAKLLAEANRIPEAIHEARICLRLRPQLKAAEKLIADLSVLPGAASKNNPTR